VRACCIPTRDLTHLYGMKDTGYDFNRQGRGGATIVTAALVGRNGVLHTNRLYSQDAMQLQAHVDTFAVAK
jgi:hypothetical protein